MVFGMHMSVVATCLQTLDMCKWIGMCTHMYMHVHMHIYLTHFCTFMHIHAHVYVHLCAHMTNRGPTCISSGFVIVCRHVCGHVCRHVLDMCIACA